MLNKQFFKKFALPELKYIAGKRYSNLLILSLILVLSMLAIGLGQGAIKYLEEKMNNPFVSFVNVKIPMGNEFDVARMNAIHDNSEIEKEKHDSNYEKSSFNDYYGFNEPYPVYENYANFTNQELEITKSAKVRMGSEDDPVYNFIIEYDSKLAMPICANNNFDFDGWGCVVSLDYLTNDKNKLSFKNNNVPFLDYRRSVNGKHEYFKIPVQGFVKSFPDDIDMIVGQKLFLAFQDQDYWASWSRNDSAIKSTLQYYVKDNEKFIDFLKSNDFVEDMDYNNIAYKDGKMFVRKSTSFELKNWLLKNSPNDSNTYKVLDFDLESTRTDISIESLDKELFVFQFQSDKLASVDKFNSFLKSETEFDGKTLEIDMSIIESKKNFDLFNKLANLLSIALIFFSIFSIVLYITNLIVSHISKNKMNLGTLKAFGLSNNNIILIYSSISITLITISFVISLFLSTLAGNLLIFLLAEYFAIGDASSLNYVSYPIYSLVSFFIILPSVFIYLKLSFELKDNTPGDLIYGRE